jgi:ribonuclease BN (tRNA processing enzyme)
MKLTVIGSGDASNGGGRGHACYLLEGAGRAPIMLDFGATALQGLKRLGRSPLELGALVFTHLHGDHIGGYPYFHVDACCMTLRSDPLVVLGPAGTATRLEALLQATYAGLLDRALPYATEWLEHDLDAAVEVLGAQVRAFPAKHMSPPQQAYCLRVRGQDGTVVAFSGDTQVCDGLLQAADGADLLVAECTDLAPPAGKHCTWAEWRELLPQVGAKRVLLTHLSDAVREAVPRLLAEAPAGVELAFADDGLVLTVEGRG